MMTLRLGNSMSQITGLTVGEFKQLRDLMSYDIGSQAAYFSGSRHNTKRSLLSKRGEFPTGLEYIFWDWIASTGGKVEIKDLRVKPKPLEGVFNLSLPHTPHLEQIEASLAAMRSSRGIISAPTGSGKGLIIALIIHALKAPVLVVVPTLELKRQLGSFLKECFGPETPIVVQNVDALDPKVELAHIGAVIIDEFHHAAAKTYRELNKKAWKNVYYRIGLTATPFRSDDSERLLLESILAEVIYEIPYAKAVDKGYIVPIEAYVYSLPKTQMKGNDKDWHAVYSELIVNNKLRNNKISEILIVLTDSGISTLCLVKEIRHGEVLSALSGAPFANGQDGKSQELIRQFNAGEIGTLIGTSGVLGEGVDTKAAEYVILASSGKSKTQFMQNVGRVMRRFGGKESGKVILFRDPSHKYLTRHFNQCMVYLREQYGVKPVQL